MTPSAVVVNTPSTRMLTRYLRYRLRMSSGTVRFSWRARMLYSSPEPADSLPSEDSAAIRPRIASSGVSSSTSTNWPCMGLFWNIGRYGSVRSAWNSIPPSRNPRKTPTFWPSGKSSRLLIAQYRSPDGSAACSWNSSMRGASLPSL